MKAASSIVIPFGEITLINAFFHLDKNELDPERLQNIHKKIKAEIPKEAWDLKKKAEEKEKSVYWLIHSPKFSRLFGQYYDNLAKTMPEKIEKELGVTEVQAWALMLYFLGMLEH